MDAKILCALLAQRIPPEHFRVCGGKMVEFIDPDANYKHAGSPNESPYDTPENRAIVEDVIANYPVLEAECLEEERKLAVEAATKKKLEEIDIKSIRSIREWLVKQPDAPAYLKEYDNLAAAERAKLQKKSE